MNDEAKERRDLAYRLRSQGLKFKEIGQQMGVSADRARVLYCSAKLREENSENWLYDLGVRATWVLLDCGINSRTEALSAYRSGRLKPGAVRNYGWASHKEVAKWLGLPEPKEPIK